MLQSSFHQLGLTQKKDDIGMIREALSFLPASHPAQWIRSFGDVGYESGLVDAFLHRREVSFCVDDCLDLLHESDLKLQRWYPNRSYYPDGCFPRNHPLYQAVSKLDETAIWRAGELFRSHPKHQFIACHKSRPESSYLIDFDSLDFMQYIPVKSDLTLVGLGSSLNHLNALDFLELQLFRHMDGKNTIKVCIEASGFRGHSETLEEKVRAIIRHLWRTDLIYLRIP